VAYRPDSVLLVATRRIGDVLLNTPLLHSLRKAWPEARIEALVYSHTASILEGNPDLDAVVAVDKYPGPRGYAALIGRIRRRYDLALTTQGTDRAFLYAWLASRTRFGIVRDMRWQNAWKRKISRGWLLLDDDDTHTVTQNLELCGLLGIDRHYAVIPPAVKDEAALDALLPFAWREQAFAVMHAVPKWRYKEWPQENWVALGRELAGRGYPLVLSGGGGAEETDRIRALSAQLPAASVTDLSGRASFAQLAALLRRCAVFIGPDTATTHLAAACGAPTVALFGPTNPVKWGPWPRGHAEDESPWARRVQQRRRHNVVLLQNLNYECVPCHGEGCDRHRGSDSRCLLDMTLETVIGAIDELVGGTGA